MSEKLSIKRKIKCVCEREYKKKNDELVKQKSVVICWYDIVDTTSMSQFTNVIGKKKVWAGEYIQV